jgi:hypothetical protein
LGPQKGRKIKIITSKTFFLKIRSPKKRTNL